MGMTLFILGVAVVFFVSGKVRNDIVAFCAMLALIVTGILTPSEALSSFGDPIIFVIIGLFVVSAGVFRTGLAKIIGSKILLLAGSNEGSLYLLMMVVATTMGVFVTGTGTVALMIPIIVSMSISKNINVSRFLMPLSFAAGIGSSFTMINASNLAVQRVLVKEGYTALKFFSIAPVGLIAALSALVFLWILSKLFLSKRRYGESDRKDSKTFDELANEYKLLDKTFFAKVKNDSPVIDIELRNLKITSKYNINIVQVIRSQPKTGALHLRRRKPRVCELAGPLTTLSAGDKIEIMGDKDEVMHFIEDNKLELIFGQKLDTTALGIAEVLLMPTSRLVGIKVKDSGFREKYRVNILAINRKGEYMTENLKDETMERGDAILVQGTWSNLSRLDEDYTNIVLVGKPMEVAAKMTFDHKAPVAGLILVGMIILIATETTSTVTAVLLAAVMMLATGCLRNVEEGYASINWGTIVLIASMIPMSTALHKTGIDVVISRELTSTLGSLGPYALLAGLYFCISVLTFFINGTALTILFAPIGFQVAMSAGVSPYPFLIAVAASTNLYFASPFSSTTNVMVAAAGRYKPKDFIKVGLPLQLLVGIIVVIALPFLYPF